MFLPDHIRSCIDMLEDAGFPAYAVGGCVRDSLLGRTPHDYDLCTAATPEQLRNIFSQYPLVLAGEKHGTVTVIMDHMPVEITTFRREGSYHDSRHPDWVRFVDDITADLSRRDFTVNAMAYSPYRGFADPFGGRQDLKDGILRAVGDPRTRFSEDTLRILRGVRFSVKYRLTVAPSTMSAMLDMASHTDLLSKERVFEELCKLLPLVKAADLLLFQPILTQIMPELLPTVGFDQHSRYHAYDVFTHTAYVVEAVPPELPLRFAALLHDIGKPSAFYLDEQGSGHFPDHAKTGALLADSVLSRLKAPTALRRQVTDLIARHMTPLEPDKKLLRRRLGKYGVWETQNLLFLQQADFSSKGTKESTDVFQRTQKLIQEIEAEDTCLTLRDLSVNGHDLLQLGYVPGPGIKSCLEHLLMQVQDELLPNNRSSLLPAAQSFLQILHQEESS